MRKSHTIHTRTKKRIVETIVVLITLFALLIYGVSRQLNIRSNAIQKVSFPDNIQETLPVVHLKVIEESSTPGQIDVGVVINTVGLEVAQADIALVYDPTVLQISSDDVELLSGFRTINVDQTEPGKIFVEMFTSDSANKEFMSSVNDLQVATLHFHRVSKSENTTIQLLFDKTQPHVSGLYPPRGDVGGVVNILSSVRGVSFLVK